MIRRAVVIACCIVFCGAPLADSFCYADCAKRETSGAHHSCTPERNDASAISAAPHSCQSEDEPVSATVEVRYIVAALGLPPSVRLVLSLPSVSVDSDARSRTSDAAPHLLIPLRL